MNKAGFLRTLVVVGMIVLMALVAGCGRPQERTVWMGFPAPGAEGAIEAGLAALGTIASLEPTTRVGLVFSVEPGTEPLVIQPAPASEAIDRFERTLATLAGQTLPSIPEGDLALYISSQLHGDAAVIIALTGIGELNSSTLAQVALGGIPFHIVGPVSEATLALAEASRGTVRPSQPTGTVGLSIIESVAAAIGRPYVAQAIQWRVQRTSVNPRANLAVISPSNTPVEILNDQADRVSSTVSLTVDGQHLMLINTPGVYRILSGDTRGVTMISIGPKSTGGTGLLASGIPTRWIIVAAVVLATLGVMALTRNRGRGPMNPRESTAFGQQALLVIGDLNSSYKVSVGMPGLAVGSGSPPVEMPYARLTSVPDDQNSDEVFAKVFVEKSGLAYFPEILYEVNGVSMSMKENTLAVLDTVTWPSYPGQRLTVLHLDDE